jgi:hypothetical protein
MYTIIVKPLKQIPVVARPTKRTDFHYAYGINIPALTAMTTSPSKISKLENCYASIMADWMTDHFVNPVTAPRKIEST